MKSRQVSFFLDPSKVPAVTAALTDRILPLFVHLPHFRGYLALECDHGSRREIIISSFWDDGLEESQEASDAFIQAVHDIAGTNPRRETYDILAALVTDGSGALQVEIV